jgi:RimJ/RimL family protein N-acetyltransferase
MTTILVTERLIVRDWQPETDAEQALIIYSNAEVTKFIQPPETSLEFQRQKLTKIVEEYAQLNNGTGFWALAEKDTETIVGAIMLEQLPDNNRILTEDYEIGWHLRRDAWGKGYATEAGQAMLKYGFSSLNLPVIYAVVKPENQASIRVTQRLGMQPLGLTNHYYGIELLLFQKNAPTTNN